VGRLIWDAKKNYYERVLNELPRNQSKLFNLSRRLFGLNNHECANHNLSVNANVSEAFSKCFSEKVNNVRTTLKRINQASSTIDPLHCDKPFAGLPLMEFPSATIDDVEAIIHRSSSKSCDLDPLPTALLKLCLPELLALPWHLWDINISPHVRSLGVIFDSALSFAKHIDYIIKSCNFYIRNIGRIRQFLSKKKRERLVVALVTSPLDYCNSLLNCKQSSTLTLQSQTQWIYVFYMFNNQYLNDDFTIIFPWFYAERLWLIGSI